MAPGERVNSARLGGREAFRRVTSASQQTEPGAQEMQHRHTPRPPKRGATIVAVVTTFLTCLVGIVAANPAVASVVATTGFATISSDADDDPAYGMSAEWWAGMPSGGGLTTQGDGTYLYLTANGGQAGLDYDFILYAPTGQTFGVGTYPASGTATATRAGMHFSAGSSSVCNNDTGSIRIDDIHYGVDGEVDRLDMSWVQHCNNDVPAAYGQFVVNEPQADPMVLVMPSARISFPPVYSGFSSAVSPVRILNTGTGPLHPTAATLTGADAALFSISGDGCAGHTIAVGASCSVGVRFKGATALDHTAAASLVEHDDSTAATHTVDLAASLVAGHTSWDVAGDPTDRVVGPVSYAFTPKTASLTTSGGDSSVFFRAQWPTTSGPGGQASVSFGAGPDGVLAPGTYNVDPTDPSSPTFN